MSRARGPRLQSFRDIVVYPTQAMLKPPFMLYRGGPDWPRFWSRIAARHCRLPIAVPLDIRPRRDGAAPAHREAAGIWCGPMTRHFGHAVAEFATRIAWSSRLARRDLPLVFSAAPADDAPPAFFDQLLAHYGVAPERVRIVTAPTRFDRLDVFPQAERLFGGVPDPGYLALLDEIAGPVPAADGARLFVSRAALPKGRFAGEAYLEEVLAAAGYATFRPEDVPLAEQLARYRAAAHLVFSEGSALHALQLLGRLRAAVTVLVRRPGVRLASAAIGARVPSLDYVDGLRGVAYGVRRYGRPQVSAGISILDEDRVAPALARAGLDIAAGWDPAAYRRARDADIAGWAARRLADPKHAAEAATIDRSLRRAGLAGLS